jgi:hypothetical protein
MPVSNEITTAPGARGHQSRLAWAVGGCASSPASRNPFLISAGSRIGQGFMPRSYGLVTCRETPLRKGRSVTRQAKAERLEVSGKEQLFECLSRTAGSQFFHSVSGCQQLPFSFGFSRCMHARCAHAGPGHIDALTKSARDLPARLGWTPRPGRALCFPLLND